MTTMIENLTALALISALPDDALLTVEEAAVFCRCSVSKMNKMRTPGYPVKGPEYMQAGKKGARGSNQAVLYPKSALVKWVRENMVSDTHEAAVRKGQMFATLADCLEERAFWRTPAGVLAGLVEKTDSEVFFSRLFKWTIEWMPALEAARGGWDPAALGQLKGMGAEIDSVFGMARAELAAAVERVELSAERDLRAADLEIKAGKGKGDRPKGAL
jgi:hypothetical protein